MRGEKRRFILDYILKSTDKTKSVSQLIEEAEKEFEKTKTVGS